MTEGRGVQKPPKLAHIICEQPLIAMPKTVKMAILDELLALKVSITHFPIFKNSYTNTIRQEFKLFASTNTKVNTELITATNQKGFINSWT